MIQTIDFMGGRCRQVVSRSNARPTGKYFSWKTQSMHQFESLAERDVFRFLDCDPSVQSFLEQPCVIRYRMDSVNRVHFPDILVRYLHRKELCEVKTSYDAHDPEVESRTDLMERALPAYGYTYRLILAESLATRQHLQNQELLLRFGRTPVPVFARTQMLAWIRERASITWEDACVTTRVSDGKRALCRLVLEGLIVFDPSSRICPSTNFTPKQGGIDGSF